MLQFTSLLEERRDDIECINLSTCNITDSLMSRMLPYLQRIKNLRQLDLSNNALTRLPKGIEKLRHLEALYIKGNHLLDPSETIDILGGIVSLHHVTIDLTGNENAVTGDLETEIIMKAKSLESYNGISLVDAAVSIPKIQDKPPLKFAALFKSEDEFFVSSVSSEEPTPKHSPRASAGLEFEDIGGKVQDYVKDAFKDSSFDFGGSDDESAPSLIKPVSPTKLEPEPEPEPEVELERTSVPFLPSNADLDTVVAAVSELPGCDPLLGLLSRPLLTAPFQAKGVEPGIDSPLDQEDMARIAHLFELIKQLRSAGAVQAGESAGLAYDRTVVHTFNTALRLKFDAHTQNVLRNLSSIDETTTPEDHRAMSIFARLDLASLCVDELIEACRPMDELFIIAHDLSELVQGCMAAVPAALRGVQDRCDDMLAGKDEVIAAKDAEIEALHGKIAAMQSEADRFGSRLKSIELDHSKATAESDAVVAELSEANRQLKHEVRRLRSSLTSRPKTETGYAAIEPKRGRSKLVTPVKSAPSTTGYADHSQFKRMTPAQVKEFFDTFLAAYKKAEAKEKLSPSEYLTTFIGHRYGIKKLSNRTIENLVSSLAALRERDSTARLFDSIISNKIDLGYADVHRQLEESVIDLLATLLRRKNPGWSAAKFSEQLSEIIATDVSEGMWTMIIKHLYGNDVALVTQKVRRWSLRLLVEAGKMKQSTADQLLDSFAASPETLTVRSVVMKGSEPDHVQVTLGSGRSKAQVARERFARMVGRLPTRELIECLQLHQISRHEQLLAPLADKFSAVVVQGHDHVSDDTFARLILELSPDMTDLEVTALIDTLDPNKVGRLTFTDYCNTALPLWIGAKKPRSRRNDPVMRSTPALGQTGTTAPATVAAPETVPQSTVVESVVPVTTMTHPTPAKEAYASTALPPLAHSTAGGDGETEDEMESAVVQLGLTESDLAEPAPYSHEPAKESTPAQPDLAGSVVPVIGGVPMAEPGMKQDRPDRPRRKGARK
ncbi:Leucine Rich repeats (2 copies) [Carpediemonas membranifera]|uniref:Leucine Rich repeats (2 copies) n=1 Tax=Carpediemonas membranifera TaxID=201153 RepID=A0A8J6E0E3_9EUKA|nr:Leucine Rich repeats (2 copies) [Carpediemonas membranifera]|eukprot:KAG9391721.1 Leucine Rich repeats (2 copies) [Carpediemonas membranifera]